MGCSKCKKNQTIKNEIIQSTEFIQKGVVWFVFIWSIFAIYGIYRFITDLI